MSRWHGSGIGSESGTDGIWTDFAPKRSPGKVTSLSSLGGLL
jgi:hypothetical protein